MSGRDQLQRYLRRHPHPHRPFFWRPALSRRALLRLMSAGVSASFLFPRLKAGEVVPRAQVETKNTARNVIFILLAGAISQIDTFDFKLVPGVTPGAFQPERTGGELWPAGLLPKIGERLSRVAIVRSMLAWALQHSGMQTWVQIGRNPSAALGDIAPNIGSVVALEKEAERRPHQVFPGFLALNAQSAVGPGYLPPTYAPFQVEPSAAGLSNTAHPVAEGEPRFAARYKLLEALDAPLRRNSPLGRPAEEFEAYYEAARKLMYNPAVERAFSFTAAESERYGNSPFGNACLVAAKVLAADQGTRYIQIVFNGWDHHQDIYSAANAGGLPRMARQLDAGFAALLDELAASGLLGETLILMMGEFGRTVGPLSPQAGRDHFLQHFVVFAGGGVKGGKIIGATDPTGSITIEPGWSRRRDARIEDVEATIYSALGINWTNVRYDDPFGRGFEYVPRSKDDIYGPIHELWA